MAKGIWRQWLWFVGGRFSMSIPKKKTSATHPQPNGHPHLFTYWDVCEFKFALIFRLVSWFKKPLGGADIFDYFCLHPILIAHTAHKTPTHIKPFEIGNRKMHFAIMPTEWNQKYQTTTTRGTGSTSGRGRQWAGTSLRRKSCSLAPRLTPFPPSSAICFLLQSK